MMQVLIIGGNLIVGSLLEPLWFLIPLQVERRLPLLKSWQGAILGAAACDLGLCKPPGPDPKGRTVCAKWAGKQRGEEERQVRARASRGTMLPEVGASRGGRKKLRCPPCAPRTHPGLRALLGRTWPWEPDSAARVPPPTTAGDTCRARPSCLLIRHTECAASEDTDFTAR